MRGRVRGRVRGRGDRPLWGRGGSDVNADAAGVGHNSNEMYLGPLQRLTGEGSSAAPPPAWAPPSSLSLCPIHAHTVASWPSEKTFGDHVHGPSHLGEDRESISQRPHGKRTCGGSEARLDANQWLVGLGGPGPGEGGPFRVPRPLRDWALDQGIHAADSPQGPGEKKATAVCRHWERP